MSTLEVNGVALNYDSVGDANAEVILFIAGLGTHMIRWSVRRGYDPTGFARKIAAVGTAGDLRPLLARITAPSLIVHGADDALIPAACGAYTAASIRDAEFMLIEEMGHDLPPSSYEMVADGIHRIARRASMSGADNREGMPVAWSLRRSANRKPTTLGQASRRSAHRTVPRAQDVTRAQEHGVTNRRGSGARKAAFIRW
jgi:hypothetical protein